MNRGSWRDFLRKLSLVLRALLLDGTLTTTEARSLRAAAVRFVA